MERLAALWNDLQGYAAGGAVILGVAVALRAAAYFGPAWVVGKVHAAFEAVRSSPWLRKADRPTRLRLFFAFVAWLEEELPDPGTGSTFYAYLGERIAGSFLLFRGTGAAWAKALEANGDKVDLELDANLAALKTDLEAGSGPAAPPPSSPPAA